MGKYEKTKSSKAEEEEDSKEDPEEEYDMSLLSRRVNQLQKKRQSKFRGSRRTGEHSESKSGLKKSGAGKDLPALSARSQVTTRMSIPR